MVTAIRIDAPTDQLNIIIYKAFYMEKQRDQSKQCIIQRNSVLDINCKGPIEACITIWIGNS